MSKKCPNCGKEIPEESSFCLFCFTPLGNKAKASVAPVAGKKSFVPVICAAIAVLLISAVSLLAVKYSKPDKNIKNPTQIVTQTQTVPETDSAGENVTDAQGNQVFEVVTVTQVLSVPTTEKKSLFDKLFETDEGTNAPGTSTSQNTTTTQKDSFFDKLFGNSQEDTAPPSTTQKPTQAHTTEMPTTERETQSTTVAQTTEKPAQSTTAEQTTLPQAEASANDFEYTVYNEKIMITRYTGKDSTVTVPAVIEGKNVEYIGENTFANNGNITKIVFESRPSGSGYFYLPTGTAVFNNLPSLTSVTFPYETYCTMYKYGMYPSDFTFNTLFTACPRISGVYFSAKRSPDVDDNNRMRSIDGVVYTKKTHANELSLAYYPVARTSTSYTVSPLAYYIEDNAILNNPYIQTLHFTRKVKNTYTNNFFGCTALCAFTSDYADSTFFVEDGILYINGVRINDIQYTYVVYPPAKRDVNVELNSGVRLYISDTSFHTNPYVKTIKFPVGTRFERVTDSYMPPALEKVIVPKDVNNVSGFAKDTITVEYY